MMTSVVITAFAFASAAIVVAQIMADAIILAVTAFAFALATSITIIAAIVANAVIRSAAAIVHCVPANRILNAMTARDRAVHDGLMNGPVIDASAATANVHAGASPAMRLTRAAGKQ